MTTAKEKVPSSTLFEPRRRTSNDIAWQYTYRLAGLRLPASVRDHRCEALDSIQLTEEQRTVANALTVLADAAADGLDMLDEATARIVRRMLDLPIPDPTSACAVSGGYIPSTTPFLPGRVKATEQAVRYVQQLGDGAAASIFRIAHKSSVGECDRIRDRLNALGHADANDPHGEATAVTLQSFVRWRDSWDVLLRATTQIADQQVGISRNRCWRLPTLAALFDALGGHNVPAEWINVALADDQERLLPWLRAVAHAAQLNRAVLAAEAYAALNAWDTGDRVLLNVLFSPPSSPVPEFNPQLLEQEDIDVLIGALTACSDWIAGVAAHLLFARRDPRSLEKIERLRPTLPLSRRTDMTRLVIALSADPAATGSDLLNLNDPAT